MAFAVEIKKVFGVNLKHQYWLGGRVFDFRVPEKNILFECDGSYWHSNDGDVKNDKLKNEIAQRNGFVLQ